MMQTLTKKELAWIYSALEKEVNEAIEVMNQSENNNLVRHLAECKRDALRGTMHKIHTALNESSKRIGIK